jgi:ABC-2 type transport system ATP-binding protein
MKTIIKCEGVTKRYGVIHAVDKLDLSIATGEVFGLVGPNGAGKTTLIEMIEGLRSPDSGSITVLGFDPASQAEALHEEIGVQLHDLWRLGIIAAWLRAAIVVPVVFFRWE